MNRRLTCLLSMLSYLFTGCLGGQSGGEIDAMPPETSASELVPCPCPLADRAVAVRATLGRADACGVEATVDEVLGGGDREQLAAGDRLSGLDLGCSDLHNLGAGDQVLLLWAPTPGPVDVDAGQVSSEASVFVVPAGAPIMLEDIAEPLPESTDRALGILLDFQACLQWHDAHRAAPDPELQEQDPEHPIDAEGELVFVSPGSDEEEVGPACSGP